ncbi:MAG: AbrB/MazE/SpoVT family DNA-binding domain-containing protein [Rhodocyclaceae bacterium]|jgi:hypothetical protein|nr:AbrB/MazE/SpoVT family DNA-binding domain-containing protein [Rhodocyclaceae bacterium]MCE2723238.1 AbrB/MazE/SpoVT family DNA-binding domain-containing protein [Betaproteobacteria bacterium]MCA3018852.1 AbrB/MazE/SpoVT family DNA-binding domain-containing protein [Rhodocyclaceae bacterium]MCA3024687.1 AbrB/MazE/SpoVT family DNA-binding domain-containing protein [Rhodocyclaceae bacterium]MCA3028165.1 AbrB/MazE/SpoVT family DNA-binding domain-containing protein [Rhodocyclaceae bacterium]
MLAKLTSKNQLTLPKAAVEQVRAEYYAVRTEGQSIVLIPVKLGGLDAVQEKLAALGITEKDTKAAVGWARGNQPAIRKGTQKRATRRK